VALRSVERDHGDTVAHHEREVLKAGFVGHPGSLARVAPTAVGTRLRCERCGTEIIVVKATDGAVSCCGAPMAPRPA
jgi:Desulfoferrodoxin, N-terminal domain